jgi:hypothetical protein
MARNRFEQVDEPQADAITLSLAKKDGDAKGKILCPAAVSGGRLPTDMTSEERSSVEAFRAAIRLANEIKAPVVVMDPDQVWQAEWGDLYRQDDV